MTFHDNKPLIYKNQSVLTVPNPKYVVSKKNYLAGSILLYYKTQNTFAPLNAIQAEDAEICLVNIDEDFIHLLIILRYTDGDTIGT